MDFGYTVAQIREAEGRAFEVVAPGALMQRAAAGLAAALVRRLRAGGRAYGARVLLVVGSGNNGGDALYAGARLARRGVRVEAWRVGTGVHAGGWTELLASGGREVDAASANAGLSRCALVVDAVAGIGSRPGLDGPVAEFAAAVASGRVPLVAVDLPSGLSPEPPFSAEPHFEAALTVTFGGLKACQLMEPARSACGEIELVDIGLDLPEPAFVRWDASDLAKVWPVPDARSDKYSRGVVGLDTGSPDYPGAGVLSAAGAVGAGAGMVRYLGGREVGARVLDRFPNIVLSAGRVQALVLGSGWGERKDDGVVARAVAAGVPLVVDADGLRHLPERGRASVVLTPHAGELAALLGASRDEVAADPVAAVRAAAERTGCTVLLKGASQFVATPGDARVWIAVPGPAWTAQAGSGDVLAGICGTLLAAGLPPVKAALAAASVQALTASAHPGPMPPHELAARLVVPTD
ncbi:MAG TPA: bifunctional ADP-dependent NAD(P)H-hydrate dehydratase/NAD(P)H-hydrate epimerase [Propionicimonas sp.]|nr:bifunctional ADP-dependent NAD(P)H-hydrate dehydratase/NAD(P)H-hydrate epimerase [Propionicimonas sp.]HRA07010.1 bifunctional ADP-dependent NAD(P)H-hydrate dehydratase/NAD(P)H-hydrate epimerase [Propionicimonas sp.]